MINFKINYAGLWKKLKPEKEKKNSDFKTL